ncbi:MAG: hypothetical protein AAB367_02735 [Patescibacteria group bacterium]
MSVERPEQHGENLTLEDINALKEKFFDDPEGLVEKLRAEKECLQYVFKTAKGSWYFVEHEGRCLRIKFDGKHYYISPVTNRIAFVEEEIADNIMARLREEGEFGIAKVLKERPIPTTVLREGAVPLEFGAWGNTIAMRQQEDGSIEILGTEHINTSDQTITGFNGVEEDAEIKPGEAFIDENNIMGFHVGHAIVEIEKNGDLPK